MNDIDVAVVGAGPAGAVAACLLARTGRSVQLLDPHVAGDAPPKPGDALAGAAGRVLRACDLTLPSLSAAHRAIGGTISAWGGPEPVYRDFLAEPDGMGWRLDRRVFEADLVAAARAAGAGVRTGAVVGVDREGAGRQLRLRDGSSVFARWLVDATGRAASVARRIGARRHCDEDLVAVVGFGKPDTCFTLQRSLVETMPEGWWYAALLPDRRPVCMLHTSPGRAAHLRAVPEEWCAALAETRHISRAFPALVLEAPLRGHEACGAWLEPVFGNGWVACGDAALSFDPCAGQGIFSALYSGMAVAQAVEAASRGDMAGLTAYAARCDEIRLVYRQRVQVHYADERRWPEADFWRERSGASPRPATPVPMPIVNEP